MAKKLKVSQITVRTENGTDITLTLDEAKELYEQLHKLFGEKVTYIPNPIPIVAPNNPWQIPYTTPMWCSTSTDSSDSYTRADVTPHHSSP